MRYSCSSCYLISVGILNDVDTDVGSASCSLVLHNTLDDHDFGHILPEVVKSS